MRLNPNELLAEHILPFVPRAAEIDQAQDKRLASCGKILAECTSVNAVATELMRQQPWDFMAVYFDAIDHFCHAFMRYHPPRQEHVDERDFELYRGVVEAGYRYHDMMLNTLVEMAGPETTVILMSDHGFHPDHLRPKSIPAEPAGPAFEHRDFGIFVMAGPGIEQDKLLHGVNLLDVTPTLLALFGLPVGQDMDGRPILEALRDPPPVEAIPSWDEVPGEAGLHPPDMQLDPVESQAAIQQLVALGYIEPPPANRQQAIDNTVRELRYNLARSYMDDGRHGAAAEILEELYERWPNEHRFGVQLAACYQALERIADLRSVVEDLATRRRADADAARQELREFAEQVRARQADATTDKERSLTDAERLRIRALRSRAQYNPRAIDYLWGCVALAEGNYEQALGHLAAGRTIRCRAAGAAAADRRGVLAVAPVGSGQANLRAGAGDRSGQSAGVLGVLPRADAATRIRRRGRDGTPSDRSAVSASNGPFLVGSGAIPIGPDAAGGRGAPRRALDQSAFCRSSPTAGDHSSPAAGRLRAGGDASAARARDAPRTPRGTGGKAAVSIDGKRGVAGVERLRAEPPSCISRWGLGGASTPATRQTYARPPSADGIITVVSGLPRSGTSMVMQMLAAGGMEILADDRRRSGREQSPRLLRMRTREESPQRQCLVGRGRGKAVKIITQLLPALPMTYRYRILYIERDLDEVLASQRRMLARDGQAAARISDDQLRRTFSAQSSRIRRWLARQANVELLAMEYRQIIANPRQMSSAIAEFLGDDLRCRSDGCRRRSGAL